ncbi:WNK lysine deficient protein kinase 2 [Rhizoctonia solani]|uniref:WNK lysine deficient protein kinase 2 n=1 Tax=Rhizoctonia solani TaxID=456999 RepID=A0A8H8SZ27_9AGAM|nr:WNK lysine deficient protein kinase 2 [Rhizoctonia solani]QRW23891.1 WNK lysine deficient protein kinase 2 [Rhizoctonia solani]
MPIVTGEPQRVEDSHEALDRGARSRSREPSTHNSSSPPRAITRREARPAHMILCYPKPSIRTVAALGGPADTPRPPEAAPGPPTRTAPRTDAENRGQAALDALALGYDVQLPDCSFALLPRTSVSEQALASFVSTGIQQAEQLPRSTSFADQHRHAASTSKQHRNRGSDVAEKKRFARQVRSPVADARRTNLNEDWIMNHSISESSVAPTPDSSSRASTSYRPNISQYVLDSPHRSKIRRFGLPRHRDNSGMNLVSSHPPRSMADVSYQSSPVRRHSMIIHQTPSARPQSQNNPIT